MEAFVYSANALYLASYLVRDMLHLRILTIVAACCLVTYFYTLAEPLMTVVYWNLFFVGLNAVQLGFILRSRFRAKRSLPEANAPAAEFGITS